jgi:hypothetical protein
MNKTYINRTSGDKFKLLCTGAYFSDDKTSVVAIYHPIDMGNNIFVMDKVDFDREFRDEDLH